MRSLFSDETSEEKILDFWNNMSYTFDEVFLVTDIIAENESVLGVIPHDGVKNDMGLVEEQYHMNGKCFIFKAF